MTNTSELLRDQKPARVLHIGFKFFFVLILSASFGLGLALEVTPQPGRANPSPFPSAPAQTTMVLNGSLDDSGLLLQITGRISSADETTVGSVPVTLAIAGFEDTTIMTEPSGAFEARLQFEQKPTGSSLTVTASFAGNERHGPCQQTAAVVIPFDATATQISAKASPTTLMSGESCSVTISGTVTHLDDSAVVSGEIMVTTSLDSEVWVSEPISNGSFSVQLGFTENTQPGSGTILVTYSGASAGLKDSNVTLKVTVQKNTASPTPTPSETATPEETETPEATPQDSSTPVTIVESSGVPRGPSPLIWIIPLVMATAGFIALYFGSKTLKQRHDARVKTEETTSFIDAETDSLLDLFGPDQPDEPTTESRHGV